MADHLALWIPAGIVIAGAIFNSGVFFTIVKFHGKKLEEHDHKFEEHDQKFENHTVELTKLVAWHDGFTAGTHRG